MKPSDEGMCDNCGERPWTHNQTGYDLGGDTDERIYFSRWVCDECESTGVGLAQ